MCRVGPVHPRPERQGLRGRAADHLGVADTIGCGNGTDAITLVLSALGIGPGDEVICPAFTFYATASPIARLGATVFADIEAKTMNIDPADVAAQDHAQDQGDPRVHLFGRPAKIDE